MKQEAVVAERAALPVSAKWIVGCAWLWLLISVLAFTDAACNFLVFLFLFGTGGILAFAWIIVSHLHFMHLSRSRWKRWLSVPLIGILGIFLCLGDWDLGLRVALCEDDLIEFVESVQPGADPDFKARRVGLFFVDHTSESEGVVYLYTSCDYLDRFGIAYVPQGRDIPQYRQVKHLHGHWYRFREKF